MSELELSGFEELAQTFRELEDAISVKRAGRELTGVLVNSLKVFRDQARARAHRLAESVRLFRRREWRTNPLHMADAITAQWAKGEANEVAAIAGVPRSHFWGVFLEYGTRFARAFPFLRPAWEPGEVLDRVAEGLRERLDRVARRRSRAGLPTSGSGAEFPLQPTGGWGAGA